MSEADLTRCLTPTADCRLNLAYSMRRKRREHMTKTVLKAIGGRGGAVAGRRLRAGAESGDLHHRRRSQGGECDARRRSHDQGRGRRAGEFRGRRDPPRRAPAARARGAAPAGGAARGGAARRWRGAAARAGGTVRRAVDGAGGRRPSPGGIAHDQQTEGYLIISGSGTLVTGGKIVNGRKSAPDGPVTKVLNGPSCSGTDCRRRHREKGGQDRGHHHHPGGRAPRMVRDPAITSTI